MGSLDNMGFDIQWRYKQPLESELLSVQMSDVIPAGVVSGFEVAKKSATTITVSPGVLWINGKGGANVFRVSASRSVDIPLADTGSMFVMRYTFLEVTENYPDFALVDTLEADDILLAYVRWGKDASGNPIISEVDTSVRDKGLLDRIASLDDFRVTVVPDSLRVHVNAGTLIQSSVAYSLVAREVEFEGFAVVAEGDFRNCLVYATKNGVFVAYGNRNDENIPTVLGSLPLASVRQFAGETALRLSYVSDLRATYMVDTSFPIDDVSIPRTDTLYSSIKVANGLRNRVDFLSEEAAYPTMPAVGNVLQLTRGTPVVGQVSADLLVATPDATFIFQDDVLTAEKNVYLGDRVAISLPLQSPQGAVDVNVLLTVRKNSSGTYTELGSVSKKLSVLTDVKRFIFSTLLLSNSTLAAGDRLEYVLKLERVDTNATVNISVGYVNHLFYFATDLSNREFIARRSAKPTFKVGISYRKGDVIYIEPPDYGTLWTPPASEVAYPWVMTADNPYNLLGKAKTYQAQTSFTLQAIRLRSTKENNTDNPITDKSCIGSSWVVDEPQAVVESGSYTISGRVSYYTFYAGSCVRARSYGNIFPFGGVWTFPVGLMDLNYTLITSEFDSRYSNVSAGLGFTKSLTSATFRTFSGSAPLFFEARNVALEDGRWY